MECCKKEPSLYMDTSLLPLPKSPSLSLTHYLDSLDLVFRLFTQKMAPKLFRRKKRVNLSFEPPPSASLFITSDESLSMSSSRRIDRSASQLIDSRRVKGFKCLSQFPSELECYDQNSGYCSQDEPSVLFSSESSSRCLLNNDSSDDEIGPVHAPVKIELSRFQAPKLEQSSTLFIPASPEKQAVALRVSLHCKACEGKVRRHISKMEGVTSFSVDLATKKVMVVGDVTPLGVLNSISKVKNAQFWPSLSTAAREIPISCNHEN